MEVIESFKSLPYDSNDFILTKVALLNDLCESTFFASLNYDIYEFFCFKCVFDSCNIIVMQRASDLNLISKFLCLYWSKLCLVNFLNFALL